MATPWHDRLLEQAGAHKRLSQVERACWVADAHWMKEQAHLLNGEPIDPLTSSSRPRLSFLRAKSEAWMPAVEGSRWGWAGLRRLVATSQAP